MKRRKSPIFMTVSTFLASIFVSIVIKSPLSKYHTIGQLLIKPQPEKVTQYLQDGGKLIKASRGKNLHQLLMVLNPKLNGFANYYRFVVSQATYQKISNTIWQQIYKWLRQSHPKKSAQWVMRRYSKEYGRTQKSKTFEMNRVKLYLPKFMPIVRFKKIKSGIRIYDNSEKARAYWEKRAYTNSLSSIYSIQVAKLFKRQHGRCPICRKEITSVQVRQNAIHTHHLNPKSRSADHRLTNLRLIHDDCHIQLHRILSLEEMTNLAKQAIDYCDKDYLYQTFV
ncbi:HNH endonuclease [bacterium]|nr:HNH endonuclease [bacterium]